MGAPAFREGAARGRALRRDHPDLPLEEAQPLRDALAAEGLDLVPLVAPTTPPERAKSIAKTARGFVYYVSVTGVTGARTSLPEDWKAASPSYAPSHRCRSQSVLASPAPTRPPP